MKIIKINSCDDRCPYLCCTGEIPPFKCAKINRRLFEGISNLPEWCPLEDYKENN